MTALRPGIAVALALAAATVSCKGARSPAPPASLPTADEVKSFLAKVAAASSEEGELRRFFEGGASYPADDFATVRSTEFWRLRPASRVKRLGPDAFSIGFAPAQPPESHGALTVSWRVTLPVRRGRDGQLRVLSRQEAERLATLPVPEEPPGEVVLLDCPEEGSFGRQPGKHYATELRATVQGDTVGLALRFEPPLAGPGLATDRPVKEDFGLGDEVSVEIALDADASGATGFDKSLAVAGKKFVQGDDVQAWGLRVTLRNVAREAAGPGAVRDRGEVVLEKTLSDPEVEVEEDRLTLTVPAALLPMKAGTAYRVMLQGNSGHGLKLKEGRGIAAGAAR